MIGNGAFFSCRELTSIEIPNGITSIGADAFGRCAGLTNIKIPNSVTSIGSTFSWWEAGKDFTITIYCKSDSTAKQHAEENNIPYVIDDIAPIITKLTQERFMYKNRVYR